MKKYYWFLLFLAAACSRKSEDKVYPGILWEAPLSTQTYPAGQPVQIKALVHDDAALGLVRWHVIHINTGNHLLMGSQVPQGYQYNLNQTFTPQAAGAYQVLVEAEDKAGNGVHEDVTITVQ